MRCYLLTSFLFAGLLGCAPAPVPGTDAAGSDAAVVADAGPNDAVHADSAHIDSTGRDQGVATDRVGVDLAVADRVAPRDGGRDAAAIDGPARDSGRPYVRGSLASCLLDPQCQRVAITAHQGAWNTDIPGNSMAAYQRAYDLGADGIEADLRVSQDGVIFMIHDDQITYWESLECLNKVVSQSPASEIETCTLLPVSANQTIPRFDQFVEWARGKIWIHLDVKNTADLPLVVSETIAHHATDFVFIAVSSGEVTTVLPDIDRADEVYQLLSVGSVADIDQALGALRRPNVFMLEGDREWTGVDQATMQQQIVRVHAGGLRIMASTAANPLQATADDHQLLFDLGFDDVLSYNTENGVPVADAVNAARGY